MAQQTEPPVLKDRDGQAIITFRRPDGTFFSNHPDYPMAVALHEQDKANKAAAAADEDDEVEEDEAVQPDDGDGQVEYGEMKSADLVAEAKKRNLTLPDRPKRSQVIEALVADDAEKAKQED